ncbi:restriction endonuclease subunit S [Aquipseudomonas alcaligenes]|uniref:restriction endonuclease subunit S n=1 Tax=Aquipseudomonas alcaligenes TaxID=43263 RepID=UPI00365A90AA
MSWPQVKLESIFDIARGGSPRPIDDYITDADDGLNWISIKDASNSNKYIETTKLKIKPEGLSKTRQVKPGDFLLTNSMSFGRPYIMKTTGCIHDGWLVLSGDPEKVDSDYFYHLLGSDLLKRRFSALAAGAVVKNLNIDLVKGVEIPLPPLLEQKRIAAILDKADAIRRKRQQAIQLADDFLRAVFLDMFGDPVTNPKGWSVKLVDAVAQVQGGLQVTQKRAGLPLLKPYLRVANVLRNRLELGEIKMLNVTAAEYERVRLEKDDILVVEGHGNPDEIGRCAVWSGEVDGIVHQNHLIRIRVDRNYVRPEFMNSYINSSGGRRQMMAASNSTSGLNTISVGVVKSLQMILPPLQAQDRYISISEKTRTLIRKQCADQQEWDLSFAALSQKAFSGQL